MAAVSCTLKSISIPSGPAYSRETRNDVPSIPFDSSTPISSSGNNAVYAPVVSLAKFSKMTVQVAFEGDMSPYDGMNGLLIATLATANSHVTFTGLEQQIKAEQTVVNFSVTVEGPTTGVPWGISEDISFQFQIPNSLTVNVTGSCFLKLYALVDDLPEYAKLEGIPVQFLEMMVLPVLQKGIITIEAWIEFVTWTCFASKFDENLKNNPDKVPELEGKWDAAVHSYRYNSFFGGTPNYVFNFGAVFDLDSWLTNCTPFTPEWGQYCWFGVNCYDMSAVLQTALRLGLPYHYVDQTGNTDRDVLTVMKAYRDPFGYIKPLDLIGWDMSNSPFFKEKKDKYLDLPSGADARESFGNHAWVSIKLSKTDAHDLLAVDACAGPTATPASMQNYLLNSVDVDATAGNPSKYPNFDPHEEPREYPGVKHIIIDQPLSFWRKTPFVGDSLLTLTFEGKTISFTSGGNPNSTLQTVEGFMKPMNLQPIPVPVQSLLATTFNSAMMNIFKTSEPGNPVIPLHESQTFSYGPFDIHTPGMSVTSDGTIFRYTLFCHPCEYAAVNISIIILTDAIMALEYLVGHFSMINHAKPATWDIPKPQLLAGKIDIFPQDGIPIGACMRSNVLIMLESPENWNRNILSDIIAFLENCYSGQKVIPVDPDSVQMTNTMPQDIAANKLQNLTFKVPGAIDFTLASKTKSIRVLQDPSQIPGSDEWQVPVSYVELPEAAYLDPNDPDGKKLLEPNDVLVGAFAAPDTYYTTSKEFNAYGP